MKNSIFICISIFILSAISSCSTPDYSKLIIGKWGFYQFYFNDDRSVEENENINNHNKRNKGLTIRFSPNGQYESDQPGGVEENNRITDYKVVDNLLILETDTILILEISDRFLRLHKNENSPDVMFQRINFTGTEPGRQ
jgi:hypothetical protein